jgi:multiple sugar transport system permease protein
MAGLRPLGRERWTVSVLLLPTLLGLALGAFGSVLATFALSFYDWDLIGPPAWVGLTNYLELPKDRMFMNALVNTTLFSTLYVPLTIIISFAIACLLNRRIRGLPFLRAIYFLPVVSSPTAVGLLWTWIYAQDQGVLNTIITFLGGNPVAWLGPRAILYSVVIVNVWGAIGEGMIIFLAGLQAIPKEHYEAAHIEGANAWQRLTMVTIPAMAPSLFFQGVLATIHAFQAFDYIYILTRIGNGNSSLPTLVFSIYRNGFKFFRMGDAAAQAVILTLIIFVLTLIYFRIQRRYEVAA